MVSVILPTYNGASRGFIREAIDSVLSQSYRDLELIIIDDGSSDSTREVCREYLSDPRVRYFAQRNSGPSAARNAGIRDARGEYICFIDDDDVWKADKLELQLEAFAEKANPDMAMVFTSLELIDARGCTIGFQAHVARGDIYERLFFENVVDAPSSVMISARALHQVGHFNECMKSGEELELWFRLARHFKVWSLNRPLVKYRVHEDNASRDHRSMEFHQLANLFHALRNAPPHIQAKEAQIYSVSYVRVAKKYFALRNYRLFRRYCRVARAYAPVGLDVHARYVVSYLPPFVSGVRRLKRALTRARNPVWPDA